MSNLTTVLPLVTLSSTDTRIAEVWEYGRDLVDRLFYNTLGNNLVNLYID